MFDDLPNHEQQEIAFNCGWNAGRWGERYRNPYAEECAIWSDYDEGHAQGTEYRTKVKATLAA